MIFLEDLVDPRAGLEEIPDDLKHLESLKGKINQHKITNTCDFLSFGDSHLGGINVTVAEICTFWPWHWASFNVVTGYLYCLLWRNAYSVPLPIFFFNCSLASQSNRVPSWLSGRWFRGPCTAILLDPGVSHQISCIQPARDERHVEDSSGWWWRGVVVMMTSLLPTSHWL